jgi:hypothetical protein
MSETRYDLSVRIDVTDSATWEEICTKAEKQVELGQYGIRAPRSTDPKSIVGEDICHDTKRWMCKLIDELYRTSEHTAKNTFGGHNEAWEQWAKAYVRSKMREIDSELLGLLTCE